MRIFEKITQMEYSVVFFCLAGFYAIYHGDRTIGSLFIFLATVGLVIICLKIAGILEGQRQITRFARNEIGLALYENKKPLLILDYNVPYALSYENNQVFIVEKGEQVKKEKIYCFCISEEMEDRFHNQFFESDEYADEWFVHPPCKVIDYEHWAKLLKR